MKRKEKGADEQGDEDGPPSSEASEGEEDKEKNAADLTSDSDPDSQRSDQEPSSQGAILPVRFDSISQSTHTPYNIWTAGASASSHSVG